MQRPATGAFVRAHVADWSKVPWIGGAYSYPTLGARPGDRLAVRFGHHICCLGVAS